jgi:hypothetical protein
MDKGVSEDTTEFVSLCTTDPDGCMVCEAVWEPLPEPVIVKGILPETIGLVEAA